MLKEYFKNIWNWSMVATLVKRDMLEKYKGSFIGIFWSIIHPLMLLIIYTFVFSIIFKVRFGASHSIKNFAIYLFTAMLPWIAFSDALSRASDIMVKQVSLVKKTIFPIEILPFFISVSSIVTEFMALSVLFIIIIIFYKTVGLALFFLLIIIFLQLVFTVSLANLAAVLNVFIRDISQIINVVLMVWMFGTPILYSVSMIPDRFKFIYYMNPMAIIVTSYRWIILENKIPPFNDILLLCGITFFLFYISIIIFEKLKRYIPDLI